ncbi:RNA-splicing ligase RtcB [Planctomycetes bacterium Pla163]|uniref:3'-phosphate/5'-hydroxy nucleic acid ligase n=1 Tax=Rohdeia mirabilis TaxID=2528008 RepID=A0A518CYG9_9BACT|nr:RNA-splicing ligase RtcB [Planctomycetes bacterium Pla163]
MSGPVTIESGRAPIKAWIHGVDVDEGALRQLRQTAQLPFVHRWIAAMPDVHFGLGATIGSVVPTKGAIVPAAVGVDIGCGMCAARTTLTASDLPDTLRELRSNVEKLVPHGMTRGKRDKGSWHEAPRAITSGWKKLEDRFEAIRAKHPRAVTQRHPAKQLGTLGGGNHFVEVCLDEEDRVWFMLHSGSRGVGNRIGTYFIERAKRELEHELGSLPNKDLAYLTEGTNSFDDYVEAVGWAQDYAAKNREFMLQAVIEATRRTDGIRQFKADVMVVNCHHNYVERETHFGDEVLVTRKGAVRAGLGDLGIIPGSMGAKSFIVRGKGNPDSFHSCSHGAGRVMSRTEAKRRYTVEDQIRATEGVECRKDEGVIDEIPMAYKDIDAVMAAQSDLVEVVHTLRQIVCVKG